MENSDELNALRSTLTALLPALAGLLDAADADLAEDDLAREATSQLAQLVMESHAALDRGDVQATKQAIDRAFDLSEALMRRRGLLPDGTS